jgi:hypothetical protein
MGGAASASTPTPRAVATAAAVAAAAAAHERGHCWTRARELGEAAAACTICSPRASCGSTTATCRPAINRPSIIAGEAQAGDVSLELIWITTPHTMRRANQSNLVNQSSSSLRTVLLSKRKLFVSRSCSILVLTTVLGRLRHTDAKNDVKKYQDFPRKCDSKISLV